MDANTAAADSPECVGCGAAVPAGTGQPRYTCSYCGKEQDHPCPLAAKTEVLLPAVAGIPGELRFDLGVVESCEGPQKIVLRDMDGDNRRTLPLQDLIPVVVPDSVKRYQQVYAGGFVGSWCARTVRHAKGNQVTLKHERFGSEFFDSKTQVRYLRVPMRPEDALPSESLHTKSLFEEFVNDFFTREDLVAKFVFLLVLGYIMLVVVRS